MERDKNKKQQQDPSGKQDKDLPGYPYYPPEDDIMNPQNGFKKIAADEELANSTRLSGRAIHEKAIKDNIDSPASNTNDLGIVRGTEADVTREDMIILGDRDADLDLGDDELTGNAKVDPLDEDDDLDIPGAELDDKEEGIGEEDEENNYYSLGGDRHDDLEEDANAKD
jgi:hypothetical protein